MAKNEDLQNSREPAGGKAVSRNLRRLAVFFLFLLCFLAFSLTLSHRFYGYENATLEYFRDILYLGESQDSTPAGLLAIISYLPAEIAGNIFVNPMNYTLRDFISLHTLPLLTALLCMVFFAAARQLYSSPRTAASLTLLLAFTTMIWPYSKMGMEIQHSLWILAAFWAMLSWTRREKTIHLVWAGIFAGAVILTKIYGFVTTGAFVLFLVFDGLSTPERRRRLPRTLGVFLVSLAPMIILFLLQNRLRYGDWLLGNRYNMEYEAKTIPLWRPLYGFLFSSGKSIFIYNPLLLVSICLIPRFFRRFSRLKTLYITIFGIGLLFHSLLWIWTDETWGPRKLHYLVPLGMLPLGLAIEGFRRLSILKRAAIIFFALMGIFVQLLGIGFSYEAEPVFLQWYGISSLENLRYNPRLTHTSVNYSLLLSTIDRHLTGEAHYFIYEPTFFATVVPKYPPKPVVISMKGFSWFDFWFLDHRGMRKNRFYLSPGTRLYFSLLLLVIPFLFFLTYLLFRKWEGDRKSLSRVPAAWTLLLLTFAGPLLCILYSRAYSKDLASFDRTMKDVYDFSIGDDTKDKDFLGPGWRSSEWMGDPNDSDYEIPFRWTNFARSTLYFPVKPHTPYKLSLEILWVYPTRLTIWANGHRVSYERGRQYENKTLEIYIPSRIVGSERLCRVEIQNHELHVPALEEPDKSNDDSTLGVMVYGAGWEKIEEDNPPN